MEETNPAAPVADFTAPDWDKIFRPLLFDLARRKCVLLLGPEIVRLQGMPLRDALRAHLQAHHAADISHYHERDGLYLFPGKSAKSEVQRSVSLFYEEARPDAGVFDLLPQLPFALTICINADHFLPNAFSKNLRPDFAFFHHKGANGDDALSRWERERPLIYNLCGSYLEDASLVLDYDDLFKLLKTALGTPGLPDKIRRALADAKSFFFLGFDFDKWYTQLLLRLLCEDNAPTHIAINTQFGDETNHSFLLKQFNIKFIGEGDAFLAEVCRRWQEGQVATGTAPAPTGKAAVLDLIGKNNLPDALALLENLLTADDDRALLTMAQNWHSQWEQESRLGKTDDRTLFNLKNQVVFTAQTLAAKLPDTP